MSTTGFLSMWISNTAATAMMLPILEAILVEVIKEKRLIIRPTVPGTNPESPMIGDKNVENGTAKATQSINRDLLKIFYRKFKSRITFRYRKNRFKC